MIPLPKVALVGRPNVGKSTLFNRLCGQRKAITDSRAGSTRDRNYALVTWQGATFELVDTGGLLLGTDDPLLGPAVAQADRAIDEADLVLFIVDVRAGLLPDDEAIASSLRRRGKNVVVVINKSESLALDTSEFTRLGFTTMLPLSAEHGMGIGDLLDAVLSHIPSVEREEEDEAPRLAIVGRPNVGKSSLLNSLLGAERAVVSPIPGTTRDAVDSLLLREGKRLLLVDTAGIRRVRHLKANVDHVSVVQARRALERADVAVLVLDAAEGMREMDATIGGYIHEGNRGVVIAVNKWDLAQSLGLKRKSFEAEIRRHLKFLAYAPIVFVSALDAKGLGQLLAAVERVFQASRTRVSTGQLNRELARATERFPPKAAKGNRPLSVLYGTQVGVAPPTFVLSVNQPVDLHFSYRRYLENRLRAAFGFEGTPLVVKVRTRRH